MNWFLVRIRRLKTDTVLSIHVEAKSYTDAARFARNQMLNKHEWVTESYNICDCPDKPQTFIFNGIKVWLSYDYQISKHTYLALFPGESKASVLDICGKSSIFDVKNFLKESPV